MSAIMIIMYLMMYIKKIFGLFIVLFALFLLTPKAHAVSYSLFPPSGQLVQGGQAQFVITIDTQGQSLTSSQVGLTYDTSVLQYQSTSPGSTMSGVEVSQIGTGTLILTGSNGSGFTGSGDFATVTFTIVATSSGSTELCALFTPSTTPAPTLPGTTPLPTALPATGSVSYTNSVVLAGVVLLVLFVGVKLFSPHNKLVGKSIPRKKKLSR